MRIRVGLPALAIALVLVADVLLLTQREQSTVVSLDDAVQGFRASESSETTEATSTSAVPGQPSAPAPAAAPAAAATPTAPPAGKAGVTTTAPATASPFRVPAEGVYAYRTTGFEEVSFGGGRHDYPARTFAAVRAKGGCDWDFEHRVLEEHVERRLQCSAPGQLTQKDERADVTFFGQTNSGNYTCDPALVVALAADQPGTKHTGTCRASDGQVVITTTFLGRERLTIGGVAVDALHLSFDGVMSGRADGTSRSETWLHQDTGLLLKTTRKVQTRAKAYGTTIDYREEATYELERLEPAT